MYDVRMQHSAQHISSVYRDENVSRSVYNVVWVPYRPTPVRMIDKDKVKAGSHNTN